ncbi:hypothetical protein VXC91_40960, partial [Streptomyces chiangmaiensis]|nr:hypothetical protein [Streptomyces chiangmaiensis]
MAGTCRRLGVLRSHEYARRVLPLLPLNEVPLGIAHPAQWPALLGLTQARRVWIRYEFTSGPAAVSALGELDMLGIPRLHGDNDLSPRREQSGMDNLVLCGTGDLPLLDVEPLCGLTELTNLQLQDWTAVPPTVTSVAKCPSHRRSSRGSIASTRVDGSAWVALDC